MSFLFLLPNTPPLPPLQIIWLCCSLWPNSYLTLTELLSNCFVKVHLHYCTPCTVKLLVKRKLIFYSSCVSYCTMCTAVHRCVNTYWWLPTHSHFSKELQQVELTTLARNIFRELHWILHTNAFWVRPCFDWEKKEDPPPPIFLWNLSFPFSMHSKSVVFLDMIF